MNVVKSRSTDLQTTGSLEKNGIREPTQQALGRESQGSVITPQAFTQITSTTDSGYPNISK